jgi:NAD(P)-dependent dehydrogenase (short-subunit alcohol dehydrogenase family)
MSAITQVRRKILVQPRRNDLFLTDTAAKHGVAGITKTIAAEHASDGIRANCVCPGYVYVALILLIQFMPTNHKGDLQQDGTIKQQPSPIAASCCRGLTLDFDRPTIATHAATPHISDISRDDQTLDTCWPTGERERSGGRDRFPSQPSCVVCVSV